MTSFRISVTCLLFACCSTSPFQSAAQACWTHVTPKYSNSSLLDVFFADSLHGWAVGAVDSIYKTIDGGETWMPKASGSQAWLNSVHFVDSLTGWSVGTKGTLLKTTTGGNSWFSQNFPDTTYGLHSVFFVTPQKGFVLGGTNIYKTVNGGASWTMQTLGLLTLQSLSFVDSLNGWVLGWNGTNKMFRTTDGGNSWTSVNANVFPGDNPNAFYFTDQSRGWAVGNWTIYHTVDGGHNWAVQYTQANIVLESVFFPDSLHGWVVGYAEILKTSNGGLTWVYDSGPCIYDYFKSVYMANDHTGWAVDNFGRIVKYKPRPTVYIDAPKQTICYGEPLTLTANSSGNAEVIEWYYFNDNKSISTGNTYTVSPSLPPGQYQFVIRVYQNHLDCCYSVSQPFSLEVLPYTQAKVSSISICLGSSKLLSAAGSSGSQLSYLWNTGDTTSSITVTPDTVGTIPYAVTVTAGNGCSDVGHASVYVYPLPIVNAGPDTSICKGKQVSLSTTNSSGYFYYWSSGQTTSTIKVTPAADSTFFVTVTESSHGCTNRDTVKVWVLPLPLANAGPDQTLCAGQPVTLNATGGVSYLWSQGKQQGVPFIQTSPSINYFVTVTGANTCTATDYVHITIVEAPAASVSAAQNTICNGSALTLTAQTNATNDVTFQWYLDNSNSPLADTSQIISTPTNLLAGLHEFRVRVTKNGNPRCDSLSLPFTVQVLPPIVATTSILNVSCFGANDGAASVILTGATDPVSFLWSNGDTTSSISNLTEGIYSVQISDANQCTATPPPVSITEPQLLQVALSATPVSAYNLNDGAVSATPVGGVLPYMFHWSNAATTQNIAGLAPGNYTLTLTDANGCTAIQSVSILPFNCTLTAQVSANNVHCYGGSDGQATVLPSGGDMPYTFNWSNGATTSTADHLAAGIYTISVMDAMSCSLSQSVVITEPSPLAINLLMQDVACPEAQNGAISVAISGGTPPYAYNWSAGNGSNLGVGTYTVTATDAYGCTIFADAVIVSTDSIPPSFICPTNIIAVCEGDSILFDPPITTDNCAFSGNIPVQTSGLPSGSIFPVGSNIIVWKITDVSGNTSTCSISILVNPSPMITLDQVLNDQNGLGIGSISVTPSGGTPPFQFFWTKNEELFSDLEDLSELGEGTYTLSITDKNDCSATLGPIELKNTVGTDELGNEISMRVLPNPAKDFIRVEISSATVLSAKIRNLFGCVLQEIPAEMLTGDIYIRQYPPGVYLLEILAKGGVCRFLKFIKAD